MIEAVPVAGHAAAVLPGSIIYGAEDGILPGLSKTSPR